MNEMTDEVLFPKSDNNLDGEEEDTTDTAGFQIAQDGGFEDLGAENMCLKTLLDSLHKSIVEAKGNPITNSCSIKLDTPLHVQHRQIQEIFNIFKEMKRDIKRFEDENNRLESRMSCLHKHSSTGTEANRISSEPPSEIPHEAAVASNYKAAQNIWHKFKKVNREQSLLLDIKSLNAVNSQLHDNCQTLQGRIDVLTDDLEQCQVNFQIQKDLNKAVDEKWKSDREQLKKAKDSMAMMQIQMANHQQREIKFKALYDAEVMKTENQQKQIDGLQIKCDDLLNRLGKLAGDRLIHENTNIADLSDANRPNKLAETYSELYDNEWTDAFEELISRNLTDKEAIGKLLDMILMSFHKCMEITWERYRSLQSIMSTIDIHVFACVRGSHEGTKTTATQSELSSHKSDNTNATINLEASKEEHLVCTTTMRFDQEKEIKRIWRTTTTALRDEAVKHLHSVLLTKFDVSIDAFPKTSEYLAICIDLCWKMGVQERPMHLDADVEMGDSSEKMLDLNKFRPYTNTGKRVAFVVWPALFLHEGGPMVVKGIAQGCNETN